jgi:hypothetical protein
VITFACVSIEFLISYTLCIKFLKFPDLLLKLYLLCKYPLTEGCSLLELLFLIDKEELEVKS